MDFFIKSRDGYISYLSDLDIINGINLIPYQIKKALFIKKLYNDLNHEWIIPCDQIDLMNSLNNDCLEIQGTPAFTKLTDPDYQIPIRVIGKSICVAMKEKND